MQTGSVSPRRSFAVLACSLLVFASSIEVCRLTAAEAANENAVRKFNVAADVASKSLKQFSEQAGVQVLFPTDLVTGIRTNAIRGEFTPAAALEQMVAGTSLVVIRDETTGALGIKRNESPNAPRAEPLAQSSRPME